MKKMHLLNVGYRDFAFDSLTAVTAALAALSKGTEVHRCPKRTGVYIPAPDDESCTLGIETNQQVEVVPKIKKPLGLPAPKRNTVECPSCESVAVVRGSECQSCGTYVS